MEKKEIIRALNESETRYKQLVDFLSDAVLVHSEGMISFINPAGLKLLETEDSTDVLKKGILKFVHPEDRLKVQEKFRKIIISGTGCKYFEVRLINLAGQVVFVEIALSPFVFQGEWAILIIGHNITESKLSEIALQESEERFKTMVQNINGYIYSVSYKDKKVISSYHSPKCMAITGYSPEEYTENPGLWIEMVAEEDKPHVKNTFENLKENLKQTHIEHRIRHKNGSIRWISNTYTVQMNDIGEITRMDGFILDITARKIAEEELQKQYNFLQKLIDTIPNPIYYKDFNGVFQGCNIAFEKHIGLPRREIIGQTVYSLFDQEQAQKYHKLDLELLENPGIQVYEFSLTDKDNTVHDYILNKATFKNQDSSIAGLVGVIVDISKLKRIQKELHSALEKLREMEVIINKSPAIIFQWRAEKGLPVEFVSENIKQFGYTSWELISGEKNYLDLIFPVDQNRVLSEIKHFIAEKRVEFNQDYRIVTRDGQVRWVEDHTWIRTNDKGITTHHQGIIIDITERKRAEQLLRDSEERYRTLAENSYDLICEVSYDSRFLYLSPSFTEVLGYQPDELLNKSILELVHIDDIPAVVSTLKKDSGRVVLRYKHQNGEWYWFESAGRNFRTASGEKRGVIVSRDITERKRLEQQLIQTEKLMAVGEMSAMIAHEFRNALTSVKMILQLQSESENLNQAEKNSFGVAIHSIYHMENIVQQLLNFAHPAPMELQLEDINKIIKECLPFIEIQANKKCITINKKFDLSIPPMLLHVAGIKDTIINLSLNAAQCFENFDKRIKRKITVKTEYVVLNEKMRDFDFGMKNKGGFRRRLKEAPEIVLEKGSHCALIEISDNGPGISKDHLDRIFEPFFTTKEKGSGLGLPIVKRTISALNGIITVISSHESGTIFRIYLPINRQPI